MVTSKDLYQGLRSALAPLLKDAGFARMKGASLGWTRPAAGGELYLWFQADKWGWDADWGSRFTLELGSGDAAKLKGRRERIGYLLEGYAELDELRRMNNSIIEQLPGTRAGAIEKRRLPDGTEVVARGFEAEEQQAVYGRDIWLHYYSLEDVQRWARYLGMKLMHFVSLFETEAKSEQRVARDRFNKMMGEVQAARELREKAALLEAYEAAEPDAFFRSAAERILRGMGGRGC